MIATTSRGIVLSHLKYGDTSVVATIYTESHGRKTFLIQGVYKRKSRFHASFFQPLTLVNLEMSIRNNRELQRIKELSLSQPFHSIPFDTTKSAIAIFIAEMLYKCIKEEESNPVLFSFLYNAIHLLDVHDGAISNFHIVFLLKLTKYLGFAPENNYSVINNMFDPVNGQFYHHVFSYGDQADKDVSKLLHHMLDQSFETLGIFPMNHLQRGLLLKQIIAFYTMHLNGIGEIKSLAVLKTVFEDE